MRTLSTFYWNLCNNILLNTDERYGIIGDSGVIRLEKSDHHNQPTSPQTKQPLSGLNMSSLPTTVNSIEPYTTSRVINRPEPEVVPKPLPLSPKIVVEAFDDFD